MFPTHFVFNHFPKAGGTSFFAVCRHNIPEREISPQLMETEVRLVRPEVFEQYRLIRGHFSVVTQMGFARTRYSMTLLRDPIETIVSTYNFWRTRPEEDPVTSQAKHLSFAEFVRRFADSPTIINNPYTHHFAAVSRQYPGEPADQALLLATAKHNLGAFNFVGICEQFEETVRLLCAEVGWRVPPAIPHENRSGRAQSLASIDAETKQILLQRNQLDRELYDYARELFQSRCERTQKADEGRPEQTQGAGLDASSARNHLVAFPLPRPCVRSASIRHVQANCDTAHHVAFVVTYEVNEATSELVVGILIHDAEGTPVFGKNTNVEDVTGPGKIVRQVTIMVDREFKPGAYYVTAALGKSSRPGFHYDWVDRSAMFVVKPASTVESQLKRRAGRWAKIMLGPISRPVWSRLQAHLHPLEEKIGLLEMTTTGLRDRIVELTEAVTTLSKQQASRPNQPVNLPTEESQNVGDGEPGRSRRASAGNAGQGWPKD